MESDYLRHRRSLMTGQKAKEEKPKKKPIAKVGKKRKKELKAYTPVRKKFLKDNPTCQIGLPGCLKIATEVHHASGREGKKLLGVEDFVATCRNCHRKAHDTMSKEEAKKIGFKK